jgi:hypothetical protein
MTEQRQRRASRGTITGIIREGESLTLDELDARRQQQTEQQQIAAMCKQLDHATALLQARLDQLEQERRDAEVAEAIEQIQVDLGLRKPKNWKPEPAGPSALAQHIWGPADAKLTDAERRTKERLGFLPQQKRPMYRVLSAREMDERAKLIPYQPKGKR